MLEIKDLKVSFKVREGWLNAVSGLDLSISRGQSLGLIGESGCGKTVAMQTLLRLEPANARVSGEILLHSESESVDLLMLKAMGDEMRAIRWGTISMIFQEPMKAFSPVHTIGSQIMEALILHRIDDHKEAVSATVDLLRKVGISNPEQRFEEYPHQLSGGMRQRAMIAMALCCTPPILIADEPTTALDVTIQAQVLALIKSLQEEYGISLIFITHDLGVIAEVSDQVAVMYLGKLVEYCDVDTLFHDPLHPYTRALLESIPEISRPPLTELPAIDGSVPVPLNIGDGCGFYDRCKNAQQGLCDIKTPEMIEHGAGHKVRCFLYGSTEETEVNP